MKVVYFYSGYSPRISFRCLRLRHSVRSLYGHQFHLKYKFNV